MPDSDFTITPTLPGNILVTDNAIHSYTERQMLEGIRHAMAGPPHGDECARCRTRRENHRASEARRARYVARLKRICLTHPSERALDAYTDALAYDWR